MTQAAARKTTPAPIAARQTANGALRLYRFTVDDYHRMIDVGILTPNHKVELLKGWIVNKMPQNPPHMTVITRLVRWLNKSLSEAGWTVRCQGPITLRDSEPEPDVAVARGPDSLYTKRHPGPTDVALVIEVADSSVIDDRRKKMPIYAAAEIPEFWLINLQTGHAEIYTNPQSDNDAFYKNKIEISVKESIPLILDGKKISDIKVKQLLS
jgi:Uma2 family endonuclease